jgi:hypothetical protein
VDGNGNMCTGKVNGDYDYGCVLQVSTPAGHFCGCSCCGCGTVLWLLLLWLWLLSVAVAAPAVAPRNLDLLWPS